MTKLRRPISARRTGRAFLRLRGVVTDLDVLTSDSYGGVHGIRE